MNFMELAKTRYSCRKFSDQPVSEEQLQLILEAAQCAPTATNAQAYRIWVIKTPEDIAKVNQATRNGYGAQTMLLLGAKPDDAWTREDDDHNFADVDAGIIGAHILFETHALGLGTTWVGRVDPAKLAELFPETKDYTIVGLFPIGYPSQEAGGQPSKKHTTRKSLAEIACEL